MPLPLIPVGIVVGAAAVTGLIKALAAKRDFDEAEEDNELARATYDRAQSALDDTRKRTQACLEALGARKQRIYEGALIPFVEAFDRIKHVELDGREELGTGVPDISAEVLELREVAAAMAQLVGGGAGALGAGALAGLAAYGSVGLAASASTGTAISTLSGVAASNATLAWLGGGTLAAGGLGVTGGMVVLGGIVAAPVLLVGGLLLASKGEEARENARSNVVKAKAAAETMKTAEVAARAIGRKATEVDRLLERLHEEYFAGDLAGLQRLVSRNDDYRTYDRGERELVARSLIMAVTLKNIAQAPLLQEDGSITLEVRRALREGRAFLRELHSA